jgi:hypothetical protein
LPGERQLPADWQRLLKLVDSDNDDDRKPAKQSAARSASMGIIESAGAVNSGLQGIETILDLVNKWRSYRISDVTTLKMLYLS